MTPEDFVSATALSVFRLNGLFLEASERLAGPVGLTAARWQVLGAVVTTPHTLSEIARIMGITRQSVQRVAALLVEEGLAEYLPNPAHKRAHLLHPTPAGYATLRAIDPAHSALGHALTEALGPDHLSILTALTRLTTAMQSLPNPPTPS
ncbi:MarR family winged helix-turn-helix transcriptional regulator [Actinocorallia sp. A-T 12471]|uniref:MarR family winged helix-turn-helix transcriptional regulator n=1 Tax=Actinocorallia sp. A-T 12471 TaxID=3089813 RepID=UPI0029CF313A|nr:MarR family winged helix-turn-helix transcriptional regulator [Actinocorallia sp. A-T 12471]MDX6739612.1 MarR family winged helix-turn-helix transcriptional regulator [Actinocorallia sp. A-T 12471]